MANSDHYTFGLYERTMLAVVLLILAALTALVTGVVMAEHTADAAEFAGTINLWLNALTAAILGLAYARPVFVAVRERRPIHNLRKVIE